MILYYYQGKNHKGMKGEALVRQALDDYLQEDSWQQRSENPQVKSEDCVILRGNKGKPYFKDVKIEFSISHTAELWVCLMADFLVGVDVQRIRKIKDMAIAKRFFSKQEQEYVNKFGQVGFYEIWCRKEAYVKYTGQGFVGQPFSAFSVVDDNLSLQENIEGMFLYPLIISKEIAKATQIMGAICTEKKEELWIKSL